ncbi:Aryl-alcohol dehydrogenase protein [Rutstroemia sp. NJR-2017a BBW]|nr:Aryl-alcohol dehydrogenase protein [Rutstroemia sp. NJR-2017a BBW]
MFLVLPFGPVAPQKESTQTFDENVIPDVASVEIRPMPVEIQPMPQSLEAKTLAEDWTGTTSAAMRRKLQNRLNQRASRKRRRQAQIAETSTRETGIRILEPYKRPPLTEDICSDTFNHKLMLSACSFSTYVGTDCIPQDSYLLTLLSFNVYRALTSNVHLLNLEVSKMRLDDLISPFNDLSLNSDDSASVTLDLPPSLQPTEMQKTITHHPEIDIFPFPQCRDNLLTAITTGQEWDDVEFCRDVFYGVEGGDGRTGLIVWGESWDPNSWEIEEQFAKKWAWLLKGCDDLFANTNKWRAKREERLIDWK